MQEFRTILLLWFRIILIAAAVNDYVYGDLETSTRPSFNAYTIEIVCTLCGFGLKTGPLKAVRRHFYVALSRLLILVNTVGLVLSLQVLRLNTITAVPKKTLCNEKEYYDNDPSVPLSFVTCVFIYVLSVSFCIF